MVKQSGRNPVREKLKAFLVAGVVLPSLFGSSEVRAMAILDFARMNVDDESSYVAMLVAGSAKLLREHGEPNQAQRAIDLFKDSTKKGGVNQLAANLKSLEAQNEENASNARNRARLFEVEDALQETLKDNGIDLSINDLMGINKNFAPAGPPRSHAFK